MKNDPTAISMKIIIRLVGSMFFFSNNYDDTALVGHCYTRGCFWSHDLILFQNEMLLSKRTE